MQHRAGGQFSDTDAVLDIRKSGRTIGSILRDHANGFRHLAYTISPDLGSIISGGTHGDLRAFNLKGEEIGRYVGHEGLVWSVATSKDGTFLISGGGDQTVRIWNLKTFELVVSVLYGLEGEWVMWLPQRYYMSSPAGDAMVGWQINNGPEKDPDVFVARQFKAHFYRPELVERALFVRSAKAAVEEAKQQDPTAT